MFGMPTGGAFTFNITTSLGTSTSSGIARNASAATIQTALQGLTAIGSGNCTVTGGPANSAIWYVEYIGALANEAIDLPVLDWNGITGGSGVGMVAYWDKVGR